MPANPLPVYSEDLAAALADAGAAAPAVEIEVASGLTGEGVAALPSHLRGLAPLEEWGAAFRFGGDTMTSRFIVAAIASCLAACGSHDRAGASCADACAAMFACAAHFDYDLSQTVGTQSDCIAACDAGDCPAKRQVNDCILSLSCTTGIDTYGIAALQCGTANQCSLGLLLPIGACDSIGSDVQWASGQCAEYLGDETTLDYSEGFCTGAMHGTWVSTCPTSNRVGSCLMVVEGVASRTTYYTSYTGNLADAESFCVNNTYGGEWTAY